MSSNPITLPERNMTLERLKSLYELIGRMNSVYELQELLDFVVDRALSLSSGRRGLLLLNDQQGLTPQTVTVIRGQEMADKELEQVLEFVSTTVIKDVLNKGEPRLVKDLPADERYEGLTSTKTAKFKKIRSVLAVPLKAQDQLVGLIYIDHPRRGIFGQSDLDFISAFANQAALAINRAKEHQRQVEKLTLLNELSRSVVQALDLNEVLTRIVAEVTRMLNVEASSVLLLDETTSKLIFSTSVSNGKPLNISTHLDRNQGVAGWVMSHAEPACINDVTKDPRWFGEVDTSFVTRSLLCVPLQVENRVVGVLEALNKENPKDFDAGDIALLSAFAASATIAIENAQLYQEARQARQLRALNEVAMLLSSTLDLNKIIDKGLEQTLAVLKAEGGLIHLLNPQAQTDLTTVQLGRELSHHEPLEVDKQLRALGGLTAWILSRAVYERFGDDVFLIDAQHPPSELDLPLTGDIQALAIAPIRLGGIITGLVAIISTSRHTYSLEEINLLNGIARIIGLAAQNAIHYIQVQAQTSQLTYLNEIGSALTRTLELDHVLKVIIEGVNTLLQTELTSVFLIDPDTNELVLRYSTRADAEIRLPAPWQGIAGWVATHDQPALVNDTQSDPRHLRQIAIETGYTANSILCVPLKVEGKIIGVVEVLNKTDGQQFNHHHQSLLIELTKWASIALHNARLYSEKVEAYQRLNAEQQRRIAAETRGAMAAIILDLAHTMNNIVGAIRVWASTLEQSISSTPGQPLVHFEKTIRQIRQNTEEAIKLMSTMTGPLEQVALSPANLHESLDAAVRSCWWPDNIHLVKRYGQDIPPVRANINRLETVFHNLLSNAIQAMAQAGGEIQLMTGRTHDHWIEIKIIDNGPGIPAELQPHIFDPGVSGKYGGLGIGLWLVETFIHQFGGQIECISSVGLGTTFRVLLQPAASNTEEALS
jgi:GAF domain-containing protein